jgi:hypothetical protein
MTELLNIVCGKCGVRYTMAHRPGVTLSTDPPAHECGKLSANEVRIIVREELERRAAPTVGASK